MLNPLFASVLIPGILIVLLLGHREWKWVAIAISIGFASSLAVNAVLSPTVWGLGTGLVSQLFLIVNALLCFGLARLAIKTEVKSA
jgi:serine protease